MARSVLLSGDECLGPNGPWLQKPAADGVRSSDAGT
jgi:hypothetical protein